MAGELVDCSYCLAEAPSIPKPDINDHIQMEHDNALFACGFCEDVESKFERMDEALNHIRICSVDFSYLICHVSAKTAFA